VRHSGLPYIVLVGGVAIVSTAAILIKATIDLEVAPLTIAAGRLVFAAVILTPIAWGRAGREIARMERSDWAWGLLSGVCLAIHFALWISSLAYTSIASATVLVTSSPVFVVLASWLLFRERLPGRYWCGVLLTVAGSVLVGLSDSGGHSGSNPLLGDTLALLGAASASGYLLVGRTLRKRLTLLPYIWLVYTTAAVVMLAGMHLVGQSLFGLPARVYVFMLCLAVGPQLLGHTSFNWAIKYVSATLVAVTILGEPLGSAALAYLIFRQTIAPLQFVGGAVLLVGIAIAMLGERRMQQPVAESLEADGEIAP
jgi:drug/metabolite transporter (DMT)-like permease